MLDLTAGREWVGGAKQPDLARTDGGVTADDMAPDEEPPPEETPSDKQGCSCNTTDEPASIASGLLGAALLVWLVRREGRRRRVRTTR